MAKQTDSDIYKYIKPYFELLSYNYYNAGTSKPIITPRRIPAKRCEQSDFGDDP